MRGRSERRDKYVKRFHQIVRDLVNVIEHAVLCKCKLRDGWHLVNFKNFEVPRQIGISVSSVGHPVRYPDTR